jgi:hypothetical protein
VGRVDITQRWVILILMTTTEIKALIRAGRVEMRVLDSASNPWVPASLLSWEIDRAVIRYSARHRCAVLVVGGPDLDRHETVRALIRRAA